MLASIVMTCYNRGALLRNTLSSIFRQNVPVEVVVVDDGSEDHTRLVAEEFPVVYRYLDQPGYNNQARAMNLGIRTATSDILIMQSGEVTHETPDTISQLANASILSPMDWTFARVVSIVRGQPHENYTSTANPRPLFFLCSLRRQHVLEIRGLDEDYNRPGYEDNDFADRLIKGMHLNPVFRDDIVGHHQEHPRPPLDDHYNAMHSLYVQKSTEWAAGHINHIRNLNREWGAP